MCLGDRGIIFKLISRVARVTNGTKFTKVSKNQLLVLEKDFYGSSNFSNQSTSLRPKLEDAKSKMFAAVS